MFKNSLPMALWRRFPTMASSRNFTMTGLTFRPLIHF
jgi:hypothetical protein